MAVYVKFAHYFPSGSNRNNDFRLGFDGASEVTRIAGNVIDDHRLPTRSRCTTYALIERNPRVWSRGPLVRPQDQDWWLRSRFEHVKPHPIVFRHTFP